MPGEEDADFDVNFNIRIQTFSTVLLRSDFSAQTYSHIFDI